MKISKDQFIKEFKTYKTMNNKPPLTHYFAEIADKYDMDYGSIVNRYYNYVGSGFIC